MDGHQADKDLRSISSYLSPLDTYRESMMDIISVLQNLEPEQWTLATPCPGWSVADIAAHLIDLDSMAMGAPKVDHEPDWSSLPHVTSPSHQFTERGVDYRRGTPPAELLDQLIANSRDLTDYVANNSVAIKVPWAKEELSTELFLIMRAFDVWVHELDIHKAISQPGNFGSNAARSSAQRMFASLPLIWGKRVGAPIGSSLQLSITGTDISGVVNIVVGPDGKAVVVDSITSPDNTVTLSWPDFADAYAGRVPVEITMSTANMEGELAESFISSLASTP